MPLESSLQSLGTFLYQNVSVAGTALTFIFNFESKQMSERAKRDVEDENQQIMYIRRQLQLRGLNRCEDITLVVLLLTFHSTSNS